MVAYIARRLLQLPILLLLVSLIVFSLMNLYVKRPVAEKIIEKEDKELEKEKEKAEEASMVSKEKNKILEKVDKVLEEVENGK